MAERLEQIRGAGDGIIPLEPVPDGAVDSALRDISLSRYGADVPADRQKASCQERDGLAQIHDAN